VGLLPFVLGGVLAWRLNGTFDWRVAAGGTIGVVFVMLATYYAGEYWDYEEDALSPRTGGSRFAGGSQVVQRGLLPRRAPLWGSVASVILALAAAGVLWLGYGTGPWTIPFAVVGLMGGFFYSTRPIRWVSSGLGELWIAFCYGWLPVAVGYYLQVGSIASVVHWVSIPIGLTIINVIVLNEFPDYAADSAAGKANLTVRLGRARAATVYVVVTLGSWVAMGISLLQGVPTRALWFYLPVLAGSLVLVVMVRGGRWRDPSVLEILCGANLGVNLGTTAAYLLAFVT
jgi:1,4-dihydroxy-2-naphthoate octaprenyltransferase